METFMTDRIETPLGEMILVARDGVVLLLEFVEATDRVEREMKARFGKAGDYELVTASNPFGFSGKIRRYFDGELSIIDDMPADGGGTAFEKSVWGALRKIPLGTTCSYGALAKSLNYTNAMRAVGLANGKNPIAVIVPCHRVIGANGTLTGYGGGLHRKEWLLRHERALLI
jgi:methylated-DNA-[protein]-cysteine S-methyltransferase